jgi:hypothetical protein
MSLTLDKTSTTDMRRTTAAVVAAPPCAHIKRAGRLAPLLSLLLLAPWTFAGLCVVEEGVRTALRPVATCETEMHILHGVAQVARGESLYPPIDGLPLAYHLYNPLTYLPAGLAGRCWGLDLDGMLIAGRIVSLASMVGILALVAWYPWRQTKCVWIAALAPAMMLYFHSSTLTDFFRNRPETPAILLTLAGWMIAQFRPRGWTVLCALAFVAAMAFKPTFVAAPLAIGVQFASERRIRPLAQIAFTSIVLGVAVIGASYALLGKGYFEHAVWAMTSNPLDPFLRSKFWFPLLAQLHWGSLVPATVCAVLWFKSRPGNSPILIYLAVCLAITTIAHGKVGSNLNYHGELSTVMVLTTLTALGSMHMAKARFVFVPLVCLAVGTWSTIVIHANVWTKLSPDRMFPYPDAASISELPDAGKYVARYARYRGAALILDDEIAVRVGDPAVYDWFGLAFQFSAGHVPFEVVENAVRKEQFGVIVLVKGRIPTHAWTDKLREAALASGYRLTLHNDRVEEYTRRRDL